MARLTVDRLTKRFGTFSALDDVSLAVENGEFVAILGPSGCGKTTLLRQVAGFDAPDAGRILIGDDVVSSPGGQVPPERRRIGIVFQSYALWPHMTVAQNVGYGLAAAGVREPERNRRVEAALALVELTGFSDRSPSLLSGGQRQRVALARCLVSEPSLVLLDEPLANLDVHLRASMEEQFARFHERTRTTMVYITHDQAEAMALADRIAVMDRGRVLQMAEPSQLYREPADETVARFIGEGMVVPVDVLGGDGDGACTVDVFGHRARMRAAPSQRPGRATACLHAQDLRIAANGDPGIEATLERAIYKGGWFRLETRVRGSPDVVLHLEAPEPLRHGPGAGVRLEVVDGWVIPAAQRA
jgi:iron(III) transport system ATP-binding protein